ncbi:hypothetical protein GCM10023347_06820 [Streptomyces chumphonensis]|uniref:Uncharacterized protein n=1 Tax=Streptomyces chumphonensis TaxID=1214925 RepID=A0A927F5M1_9ACTN|nr:hypothetical protein [Streptomyces chumphonensis]MBD3934731.1 hypothetical protein [Streptomyces chumphonensis]
MPNNTDFRRTLSDPTPLYFAAGVIEKVRAEAPERIAKLRETDTKAVQARFQEALATLDADVRKWREQAQHLALQGVGYAAEAAVKAKENYDALAEQGKVAVEGWRGRKEGDEGDVGAGYETTIEREPVTVTEPRDGTTKFSEQAEPKEPKGHQEAKEPEGSAEAQAKKAAPRRTTAKSTPRKATAARKTPPASDS